MFANNGCQFLGFLNSGLAALTTTALSVLSYKGIKRHKKFVPVRSKYKTRRQTKVFRTANSFYKSKFWASRFKRLEHLRGLITTTRGFLFDKGVIKNVDSFMGNHPKEFFMYCRLYFLHLITFRRGFLFISKFGVNEIAKYSKRLGYSYIAEQSEKRLNQFFTNYLFVTKYNSRGAFLKPDKKFSTIFLPINCYSSSLTHTQKYGTFIICTVMIDNTEGPALLCPDLYFLRVKVYSFENTLAVGFRKRIDMLSNFLFLMLFFYLVKTHLRLVVKKRWEVARRLRSKVCVGVAHHIKLFVRKRGVWVKKNINNSERSFVSRSSSVPGLVTAADQSMKVVTCNKYFARVFRQHKKRIYDKRKRLKKKLSNNVLVTGFALSGSFSTSQGVKFDSVPNKTAWRKNNRTVGPKRTNFIKNSRYHNKRGFNDSPSKARGPVKRLNPVVAVRRNHPSYIKTIQKKQFRKKNFRQNYKPKRFGGFDYNTSKNFILYNRHNAAGNKTTKKKYNVLFYFKRYQPRNYIKMPLIERVFKTFKRIIDIRFNLNDWVYKLFKIRTKSQFYKNFVLTKPLYFSPSGNTAALFKIELRLNFLLLRSFLAPTIITANCLILNRYVLVGDRGDNLYPFIEIPLLCPVRISWILRKSIFLFKPYRFGSFFFNRKVKLYLRYKYYFRTYVFKRYYYFKFFSRKTRREYKLIKSKRRSLNLMNKWFKFNYVKARKLKNARRAFLKRSGNMVVHRA